MYYLDNFASKNVPLIIEKALCSPPKDVKWDRDIRKACGVTVEGWEVYFTMGRQHSNELLITKTIEAYNNEIGRPHLIFSAAEHESIVEILRKIPRNLAEITFVPVDIHGTVIPKILESFIKENTCLISITYVQEDTGAVNNIPAIANIAETHKIPFHTDATRYFANARNLNMRGKKITATTIDSNAFHGPKGIGCLIINSDFVKGYGLNISHYEPSPNLALAMITAMNSIDLRGYKLQNISSFRKMIINALNKYKKGDINKYKIGSNYKPKEKEYVLLSPESGMLPNVLTFAIMSEKGPINIAEKLPKSIVVGRPSPFILAKIGLREDIINSAIRVSMSADTKLLAVKNLCKKISN